MIICKCHGFTEAFLFSSVAGSFSSQFRNMSICMQISVQHSLTRTKAVHGLVCAATIAANSGSVELGQQPQHFVARHFLQPQPFVAGDFQRM